MPSLDVTLSVDSTLPILLAVVALVSVAVAVPAAFPGRLAYGCGGPEAADLDRTETGDWLVLRGGPVGPDSPPVVARFDEDWTKTSRFELDLPANASNESAPGEAVSLVPHPIEDVGWWLVMRDGRAYLFASDGRRLGGAADGVHDTDDPNADAAPAHAVDWEDEQYGDAVDVERGDDANYVLARDGTVLEYTTYWQYAGVTHEAVDTSSCIGDRPAWPSALELLVASSAVGMVGLALASAFARDDLARAALLAVGGPALAGTFSMYLLPDVASAVYRLPDVALGVGLLAPIAVLAWYSEEDPFVAVPLLALSGASLVAAGVRFLLASGLV